MESASGRVVILNGTSSAGKSSIAERFRQDRADIGEPWVVIGIDDFLARLPVEWFAGGEHVGEFNADGVRFEETEDGLLIRLGDVGRRLLAAYRRSVATCARAGLDVVVDDVSFDKEAFDDWGDALDGLRVTWIAVRCDLAVAEARERDRGDRILGLARGQSATVHRWPRYDGEVDTTNTSADELAAQVAVIVDGAARG